MWARIRRIIKIWEDHVFDNLIYALHVIDQNVGTTSKYWMFQSASKYCALSVRLRLSAECPQQRTSPADKKRREARWSSRHSPRPPLCPSLALSVCVCRRWPAWGWRKSTTSSGDVFSRIWWSTLKLAVLTSSLLFRRSVKFANL